MADTPATTQPQVVSATTAEPAAIAVAAVSAAKQVSPAVAAQKPAGFKVSIEHFATQLSARDKRVALIHGWVHTEKVAKHFRDTAANYQQRYEAFATKPV